MPVPELVVLTEQLLAPVPGGTGRYTRELAAALAATVPDGWRITGMTAAHRDVSAAHIPGVGGPHRLPLPRRALAVAWQRGLPPWPGGDVVHAPTVFAPAAKGRPLVVTVHDTVPFSHPETLTPHGAAWHRDMITRATLDAAAIVVPTATVAAELAVVASGPAPVHVVGHGAPAALTGPTADADGVVARLGLPANYVLAVGTVEPRKGFDTLVRAMATGAAPDLPLVVAGPPGWGGVDLGEVAAAAGLAPARLHLLGRISDADLAVVLAGASVLAAPSLAEGFGLPVLEAMTIGVPVVHSDAPALVELTAGTALVAPRGDLGALAAALRRVTDDPTDTARRVAAARTRADEYGWERAATALWRVYLDVLAS